MKSRIGILLVVFMAAVSCSERDKNIKHQPEISGAWVSIDDENFIDSKFQIKALYFSKTQSGTKYVHYCGKSMIGSTGYEYDGKQLKILTLPVDKKTKDGKRVISVRTLKSEVRYKTKKSVFFEGARFKKIESIGKPLDQQYDEFCYRVEQFTSHTFPKPSCKQQCSIGSPFCLGLSSKFFKDYAHNLKSLFKTGKRMAIGDQEQISLSDSGTMKVDLVFFPRNPPLKMTLDPVDSILFQKEDSSDLSLKVINSETAPVLSFDDIDMNAGWSGRLEKVEFIGQSPVFDFGDDRDRCVYIK